MDDSLRDKLGKGWNAPWRAWIEGGRILLAPLAFLWMRIHGVNIGRGLKIYGLPRIQRWRGSRIEIGDDVSLRSWTASNPLTPRTRIVLATRSGRAVLSVGERSGLTGVVVVAENEVRIGVDVLIGANAVITDTDFHPLDFDARRRGTASRGTSVVIGDGAFIGMNAIILKGVEIGERAVVGAASVVTQSIPPEAVVAGNPARIVGSCG